jgi:hypothetical protein
MAPASPCDAAEGCLFEHTDTVSPPCSVGEVCTNRVLIRQRDPNNQDNVNGQKVESLTSDPGIEFHAHGDESVMITTNGTVIFQGAVIAHSCVVEPPVPCGPWSGPKSLEASGWTLGLPVVEASEDPREPVKVQISPREGAKLWGHLRLSLAAKGDVEQDAEVAIKKALGLVEIGEKIHGFWRLQSAKCMKLTDPIAAKACMELPAYDEFAEFGPRRVTKVIPKDILLTLVGWLKDKDRPTGTLLDDDLDVLVPLRQEFAAAANGGDPYAKK